MVAGQPLHRARRGRRAGGARSGGVLVCGAGAGLVIWFWHRRKRATPPVEAPTRSGPPDHVFLVTLFNLDDGSRETMVVTVPACWSREMAPFYAAEQAQAIANAEFTRLREPGAWYCEKVIDL